MNNKDDKLLKELERIDKLPINKLVDEALDFYEAVECYEKQLKKWEAGKLENKPIFFLIEYNVKKRKKFDDSIDRFLGLAKPGTMKYKIIKLSKFRKSDGTKLKVKEIAKLVKTTRNHVYLILKRYRIKSKTVLNRF